MLSEIFGPLYIELSGVYRIDYSELEYSGCPKETVDKLNRIRIIDGRVKVVSIKSKDEVNVAPVSGNLFKSVRIPITILRSING